MLYNPLSTMLLTTLSSNHTSHHNHDIPLTTNEAISGLLGSVSLACWLFLLLPQLLENYRNQSAEAISLAFVLVWFLGDVANLLGALWAGLVPVVIAIAVYFCISDGLLIGQCLYYGIRNRRREGQGLTAGMRDAAIETETNPDSVTDESTTQPQTIASTTSSRRRYYDLDADDDSFINAPTEIEPLLSRTHSRSASTGKYTIPGSADPKHVREQVRAAREARMNMRRESASSTTSNTRSRRKSSSAAAMSAQAEPLAKIFEEQPAHHSSSSSQTRTRLVQVLKGLAFISLVIGVGCIGWLIAYKSGTWKPTPPPTPNDDSPSHHEPTSENPTSAQFLGYTSAILYLTARLPQIWKNYRDKSCEGLSILFFVLSLLGNATYGGGILAHSLQGDYVKKNLPWLIGSLGTIAEDVVVFVQFKIYAHNVESDVEEAILDGTEAERIRGGDSMARGEGQ